MKKDIKIHKNICYLFFITYYLMTIENKRRKVYCYGNGMYVGLKQPLKKKNKDGTTQGYYYGIGFFGPDEGDKLKSNLNSNGTPLWILLLMACCVKVS